MANGIVSKEQVVHEADSNSNFGWSYVRHNTKIAMNLGKVLGISTNETYDDLQIRFMADDGSSIRVYFSREHGYLQKYTTDTGWTTLKTIY